MQVVYLIQGTDPALPATHGAVQRGFEDIEDAMDQLRRWERLSYQHVELRLVTIFPKGSSK